MSQLMQNCKCNLKYKELANIEMADFQQIKVIFMSGDRITHVIFVTKSDDVYGYRLRRLDMSNAIFVSKPTIIPELCGKGVKNVLFSDSFRDSLVILTNSMEVYTCRWRCKPTGNYAKPQKINLSGQLVIDIKCRYESTFLLTETNEVYYFDLNRSHFDTSHTTPTLLNFNNQKIKDISCGLYHTLALTDTGKVYSFGLNSEGQFGLGNTNDTDPQLIRLSDDIFVKSIACGDYHSLLLTSDGEIYTFGWNEFYQLGTENTSNQTSPRLLKADVKFIEIFAFYDTSMALNETNSIVIWGKLRDGIESRIQTNCYSFQEAIDTYCKRTYFYKPLSPKKAFRKTSINPVMDTMSKAFNNQSFSDLKFKIKRKTTADFEYIYAQKWFIANSSEYFERMFANEWSEASSNEITVSNYSYEAFYQFVRCLYTDDIETEDMELLIELLGITDEYLNDKIKARCVESIKELMDIENVCSVYCSSLRYRSKELEDLSFELMSKNIKRIVKTKDFQSVDLNYLKKFFTTFYEKQ